MARNGSGVYSKPGGSTAVSGATISSSTFNTLIDDIAADLNVARPIVAGGTGATTAEDALANLGALPLAGGTTSGTILVSRSSTDYGMSLRAPFSDGSGKIEVSTGPDSSATLQFDSPDTSAAGGFATYQFGRGTITETGQVSRVVMNRHDGTSGVAAILLSDGRLALNKSFPSTGVMLDVEGDAEVSGTLTVDTLAATNVSIPGARVLLQEVDISALTGLREVNFTSLMDGAQFYDYVIELRDMDEGGASGVSTRVRTSSDNGLNWDDGATDYIETRRYELGGVGLDVDQVEVDSVKAFTSNSFPVGPISSVDILISSAHEATATSIEIDYRHFSDLDGSGLPLQRIVKTWGYRRAATAVNAIQLRSVGGFAGTARFYGIRR